MKIKTLKDKMWGMRKLVNNGKSSGLAKVGISALRLYCQIGRIYAVVADTNELGERWRYLDEKR